MDKYGGIFHEVFGSVGKFFDDEIWAEGGYSCRIHVFSIGRTVRKNGKSFPFHDTVGLEEKQACKYFFWVSWG